MSSQLKDEHLVPQMIELIQQGKSRAGVAIALGWGPEGKSRVCGALWRARQRGYTIPTSKAKGGNPQPTGRKTLPIDRHERAMELIRSGKSLRQASAETKVSRNRLAFVAAETGVDLTPKRRPEEEAREDQVRALLKAGCSQKEVARRLRIGKARVSRIAAEIGYSYVPKPQPSRPKVVRMIPSKAQIPLELFGPPLPPRPVVKVQPVRFGKPRQCEYLIGNEKPWVRCEHNIERGSYCRGHAALCYNARAA